MKIYMFTAFFSIVTFFCHSQGWQTQIDTINKYCQKYDLTKGLFSYNEKNRYLKYTSVGRIIDINLDKVKIYVKKLGSVSYLTFECVDTSGCILTKSGSIKKAVVQMKDEYIANKIVTEIQAISTNSTSVAELKSVSSKIDRINYLCKTYAYQYQKTDYDYYFFQYDPKTRWLKWASRDYSIWTKDMNKINIEYYKNGENNHLICFTSKDQSKSLLTEYNRIEIGIDKNAITLNNAFAAKEVADLLLSLPLTN